MDENKILEKTAPLFGLRKIIRPDGSFYWRSDGQTPIGCREALYPNDLQIIARAIGLGATIIDLKNTDFTRGALQVKENEKWFWLLDGRRVNVFMGAQGLFVASVSNEPDSDIPGADFINRGTIETQNSAIQKCLHPECGVMVDTSRKKSGCCSRKHMNFECVHPSCVAHAEKNSWGRATHPFGTKIAAAHWQYRKREEE